MAQRGKKYRGVVDKVDRQKRSNFDEAIQLALDCTYTKFDETVDLAVRLGVDPRHADQMVRGTVVLPHGTGKEVRVMVFAKGEKEKEALDAGADHVGSDEYIEKIARDKLGLIKQGEIPYIAVPSEDEADVRIIDRDEAIIDVED